MDLEFQDLNYNEMRSITTVPQMLTEVTVSESMEPAYKSDSHSEITVQYESDDYVVSNYGIKRDHAAQDQMGKLAVNPIRQASACVIPSSLLKDADHLRSIVGANKKLYCIPRSQLSNVRLSKRQSPNQPMRIQGLGNSVITCMNSNNPVSIPTQQPQMRQVLASNSILNPDSTKPLPRFLQGVSHLSPRESFGYSISSPAPSYFNGPTYGMASAPLRQILPKTVPSGGMSGECDYYETASTISRNTGLSSAMRLGPNRMSAMNFEDEDLDQNNSVYKTNGLRKYARAVCDKVREKDVTTYGEVADELVHEYAAEHPMIPQDQLQYIQKNIRRRVYDALNVLMALNILSKEKKEIHWVGLPKNLLQECNELETKKKDKLTFLSQRNRELEELILQLIALKNLILRNRQLEEQKRNIIRDGLIAQQQGDTTATITEMDVDDAEKELQLHRLTQKQDGIVELPFLVLSTGKRTVIDCSVSNDQLEYLFNFDQAFEIRDDVDFLRRMGLTLRLGERECTEEEFHQCLELVPPSLRIYVQAIYEQRPAVAPDFERLHLEQHNLRVANQRVRMQQRQKYQQQQQNPNNNVIASASVAASASAGLKMPMTKLSSSRSTGSGIDNNDQKIHANQSFSHHAFVGSTKF